MNWVYCIAFVGDRFAMVFNPKREGWEMPGGRIEAGESAEQAAVREVREECGCDFLPMSIRPRRDGMVFYGTLTCLAESKGEGEMRWELFESLPEDLAFGREEYDEVLTWAMAENRALKVRMGGFSSSF
ncbi:MAG: NUDIX domain-containing protein [Methanomassiliicoccales archaeon]|jgi:8-oxo-dGTP diphosphatase|nr:NUDIX domain-containing protein [Methanomassiliicoccales archaeon]